jgi:biopolymer transport protein ExbD
MNIDLHDDEEGIEVQMAPLIDCVFLLLIFFLVATTLKKVDDELPLTLPDASASVEVQQPDGFSSIAIDREGNFYFDGARVSTAMLHNSLRTIANTNPEMKLRLDVDRDVTFQRVMQVLDLLRFEDLENVSINTKKSQNAAEEK